MIWQEWGSRDEFVKVLRKDCYRVCYATHNSYEEIRDFLLYLKPKKIHPNVVPSVTKERYEMQARIREIQKTYMDLSDDEEVKPKKKFSFKRKPRQNNDDDEENSREDQSTKRSKN